MNLLDNLNPDQQKICRHINGPVLILAGAGSGKTRVLTHRIAHLILDHRISARSILAVTFTNKAAKEMRKRVESLLNQNVDSLWIGTFHSIFARILRIEAAHIGYSSAFTIYDTSDSVNVVKSILKSHDLDPKQYNPKSFYFKISSWKDRLVSASNVQYHQSMLQEELEQYVYMRYEQLLKQNNAFDFNDLIVKPIELFRLKPEILDKYQNYFKYIMVDEYQDTNHAQYQLIRLLSQKYQNVTVVGDEDQSIYKWRGADISNILNFEQDFENGTTFRLEQNYRSSSVILNAANGVVKHNDERLGKTLWTNNATGDKITLLETDNDREEAVQVLKKLMKEVKARDLTYGDCVILYRTNAQSRVLEDALRRKGMAYQLVGGQKFYDRKEIKDIVAYLRVIVNAADALACKRIINVPARGIGDKTVEKIQAFADANKIPFYNALGAVRQAKILPAAAEKKVGLFKLMMDELQSLASELNAYELAERLLDATGIVDQLKLEGSIESQSREENIQELLSSIAEFVRERDENSLQQFLEEVQLLSDIDQMNDEQDRVTLMTMHSAKGLEFPIVFIVGMEEGLFPHENAVFENNLEEERRLFYVGITRAEQKLYLSWAKTRLKNYQSIRATMKSSFLREIPRELIDVDNMRSGSSYSSKRDQNSDQDDIVYDDFNQSSSSYRVGMMVELDVFGRGRIANVSGLGEMAKITVVFESGTSKKLVAKYANLTIFDY
jgi:DNA helicase-2/ATP-dependent DNA helicase PcrA